MKCTKCAARTRRQKVEHSITGSGIELKGEIAEDTCLLTCGIEPDQNTSGSPGPIMRAADLGAVFGVAAETVSRWETGQRDVDRHVFAMLREMAIAAAEGRPSPVERFQGSARAW